MDAGSKKGIGCYTDSDLSKTEPGASIPFFTSGISQSGHLTLWEKLLERILTMSNDRYEERKKVLDKHGYKVKQPKSGGNHCFFRKPGCMLLLHQFNREYRCGMRNRSRQGTKPQEYWTYFKVL